MVPAGELEVQMITKIQTLLEPRFPRPHLGRGAAVDEEAGEVCVVVVLADQVGVVVGEVVMTLLGGAAVLALT